MDTEALAKDVESMVERLRDLREAIAMGRAYAEIEDDRAEIARTPAGGKADPHTAERRILAAFRLHVHEHGGTRPTNDQIRKALGSGSLTDITPVARVLRAAWAAAPGAAPRAETPKDGNAAVIAEVLPPATEDEALRALIVDLAKGVDARIQRERAVERRAADGRLAEALRERDGQWSERMQAQAALHAAESATRDMELTAVRAELADERRNADDMAAAADGLREELATATAELETLRSRAATLEAREDQLEGELTERQRRVGEQTARAEAAEAERDAARRDADALRDRLAEAGRAHAAALERLGADLAEARRQREDERRRNHEMVEARVAAEKTASEATARAKGAVDEVVRLRQAHDDEQAKRIDAERMVVRLTAERDVAVRPAPSGDGAAVQVPSPARESAAGAGRRKTTRPRRGAAPVSA
ncbi:hypothetical protein [Roseomonas genomospecies 6]|nr:hypothetical protein [Roseomonas genomospecies 6]